MRKIQGLKLLKKVFPDETKDALLIDNPNNDNWLSDSFFDVTLKEGQEYSIRVGVSQGTEFYMPRAGCSSKGEVIKTIEELKKQISYSQFAITKTSKSKGSSKTLCFFSMAFHNTVHEQVPHFLIEISKMPQNIGQFLASGARIRDIEPSISLQYDFFHKFPTVHKRAEDFVMENLKPTIYKLVNMAMKFIDMKDSPTLKEDLIIKGNIKANGKITLIDCRDFTSFIDRKISERNLKEVMYEIERRNKNGR
jgi:hypothetical protein